MQDFSGAGTLEMSARYKGSALAMLAKRWRMVLQSSVHPVR
jgi:hypothetical protein